MAIIYEFKRTQKRKEFQTPEKTEAYLKKHGLLTFAENAYQRECKNRPDITALQSPYIKNAYLYSFYKIDNDNDGRYAPDNIEAAINKSAINTIIDINRYDQDYLPNNQQASENLFIAGFAHHAMNRENCKDEYISTIGLDAYSVMRSSTLLVGNPKAFHASLINPEIRLLHLIRLKTSMSKLDDDFDRAPNAGYKDLSEYIQVSNKFINHVDCLYLIPEQSEIERKTTLRRDQLFEKLQNILSSQSVGLEP